MVVQGGGKLKRYRVSCHHCSYGLFSSYHINIRVRSGSADVRRRQHGVGKWSGEEERETRHLLTNAWTVERFGLAEITIDESDDGSGMVTVRPLCPRSALC